MGLIFNDISVVKSSKFTLSYSLDYTNIRFNTEGKVQESDIIKYVSRYTYLKLPFRDWLFAKQKYIINDAYKKNYCLVANKSGNIKS